MKTGGLRRAIEFVGWLSTASAGLVMLTHAFGWQGIGVAVSAQALTPYIVAALVPFAGVALVTRRDRLAATASLIGMGGLVLAAPLAFAPGQPGVDPGALPIRIASVNLLYSNSVIDEAGKDVLEQDPDAILFTEFTAAHQTALRAHPLADKYRYKIEHTRIRAGGIAVWSRFPIVERKRPATTNYTLDIEMRTPDGTLRLLGVHPPTPFFGLDEWADDLATFGELGAGSGDPTMIIGDFNASYWHRPFRDLLGSGFTDAHIAHGRGFSTSWPTDRFLPAFVRLDHALTGTGLVSTDVADFTVSGSDHRGFIVTVAQAR